MRWMRSAWVERLDLSVVLAALLALIMPPIFFLVPFNDEWLRMNYLADHSVWQWTVMHAQTWVVRPTAELILGLASLPTTRPALAQHFNAPAFLARFHWAYIAIVAAYWLTLLSLALVASRRRETPAVVTLVFFATLVCWLSSDELAYAFYWADGYGNVLIPFSLLCAGMLLVFRNSTPAAVGGALALIAAALGHEVDSIYASGVLLLGLVFRRPVVRPWLQRGMFACAALVCLWVVLWQLFGAGPTVRSEVYFRHTQEHYDFASAWASVRQIDPRRTALAVIVTFAALSIYRARLTVLLGRMLVDYRRQRWFWWLLAAGSFVTCFLPLASVGLKKGRVAVSYYSVLTELFFVLFAVVSFPIVERTIDPLFRSYRRRVGSLLPLLLVLVPASKNLGAYETALRDFPALRARAQDYMTTLFAAHGRVHVCRPWHPYVKPGRNLTAVNEAQYFHLARVVQRCRNH